MVVHGLVGSGQGRSDAPAQTGTASTHVLV